MSGASLPPGVTVFCDPTLAPAIRALDPLSRARIGAPVAVLCAPATLMLAQITRHTRNDVLFTLGTAMDQAARSNLVLTHTRVNGFANALVLAARVAPNPPPPLARAKVAVTDATAASGLDGRAVLAANQMSPRQVLGAANTGDVAFLVVTGAADLGLVYLTDVRANPRLTVVTTLAADTALITYAGAVNAHAISPNAQAFLNLLGSNAAATQLHAAGLATPS